MFNKLVDVAVSSTISNSEVSTASAQFAYNSIGCGLHLLRTAKHGLSGEVSPEQDLGLVNAVFDSSSVGPAITGY